MKKYSQTLKVRSYELDSLGHVNNAVYLNYLEYCRVTTLEQLGIPFQAFIDSGKFIVIAEINIKYLAPSFMGDELEITLEGIKAGKSSMNFRQQVFNKTTGKQVADAHLVAVFTNKAGKPIEIDAVFRERFF